MGYSEQRAWSEAFTRNHLLPFLSQCEAELPFRHVRVTQDEGGWLQRGLDMVVKADAIAERNGNYCLIGVRCQRTGIDHRTITVRWPTEYDTHTSALADGSLAHVGYMIHSYATDSGDELLAVWVAETRRVIAEIDARWDRRWPTPWLQTATEDGQRFAKPSCSNIGALRLSPYEQLALV